MDNLLGLLPLQEQLHALSCHHHTSATIMEDPGLSKSVVLGNLSGALARQLARKRVLESIAGRYDNTKSSSLPRSSQHPSPPAVVAFSLSEDNSTSADVLSLQRTPQFLVNNGQITDLATDAEATSVPLSVIDGQWECVVCTYTNVATQANFCIMCHAKCCTRKYKETTHASLRGKRSKRTIDPRSCALCCRWPRCSSCKIKRLEQLMEDIPTT